MTTAAAIPVPGRSDGFAAAAAPPPGRRTLARVCRHLVVALVALVAIGGATRVMEAGLACPDWPLCYGTLLPGRQMNLQVFLEWFHRLDAFVVGMAMLVVLGVSIRDRRLLPGWVLPWAASLLLLVVLQAGLGALTVLALLPSGVVTAHLALALLLVALVSAGQQGLAAMPAAAAAPLRQPPRWWGPLAAAVTLLVFSQCLLGGLMATQWAARSCLADGTACQWLMQHRRLAGPAAAGVLLLLPAGLLCGTRSRGPWPLTTAAAGLVCLQVVLGVASLRATLSEPLLTVAHQVVAAVLVAVLAAITARGWRTAAPTATVVPTPSLDACHG
jgi:cytochrome c oxidase assembly protein subunit 15